ncbi:MAG: UDP-N-acetylmuramate:L-alanyl-gamma-D-glutamyl-meso-diaminopimelate ligase [Gammaproteobacteria bacterium]|nr:UDP-N-acetylmuramate:L-alanyl-gamma-D-glutamyl-meso-diaminopimelate ligase [Gammaproteobacteria bacterium]MDE0252504.1 UDP-N-acetylmuramate:L-alanyl-gamma-D-glutamyl-meso-diaminopimelate ligase [Gammaproteobacteria bacterium]MDE0403012.1 UDP-N-acetylmuramate:L-alanyl-gamma-D-glutamyl-meso-diaminopimelate ligase [Gammaproteobacteria bacterium]
MGIGGTLMGNLAILAKAKGYQVSGFDGPIYPPMSDYLDQAGITIFDQFDPVQLQPPPDLVIVGNANLPRGNPALEYVLNQGLRYQSGPEWLGNEVLQDRHVVAVAGTHGKTTTTAMIAWILHCAEKNPGYLIGGVPIDLPQASALGTGNTFVIEADEYDTSYFDRRAKFMHYRPSTLIITSIEFDHADIFPDLEAIKYQFQHLVRAVPAVGSIITPMNDPEIEEVLQRGCWTPRITFQSSLPSTEPKPNYWAVPEKSDGSEFSVFSEQHGLLGTVNWSLCGMHNVANGLAAVIAAAQVGVEPNESIAHLSRFSGVKRRLEIIAQTKNSTIYSDFAHHPTAIETTLQGLRGRVGDERIIAVVDPGTHTMSLGTLRAQLKKCCNAADYVIWYQSSSVRWNLTELVESNSSKNRIESNLNELVNYLCREQQQKTHFVLMSNGSFDGIFRRIVETLATH